MAALAGSIARRYARALFAIGVDKRNFEALGKELDAMAALWNEATDIRQSLSNPIFKLSQKRAILQGLLPQVAPTREVQSLALLLLERGRIAALPVIARAYQEMSDDKLGRARATVRSARPLDGATEMEIRRMLERQSLIYLGLCALALASAFLAGYPQLMLHFYYWLGAYALFSIFIRPMEKKTTLRTKSIQASLFVALVLDRSMSLTQTNWTPQTTNAADGSGALTFTNTPSTITPNFWRVRSVP